MHVYASPWSSQHGGYGPKIKHRMSDNTFNEDYVVVRLWILVWQMKGAWDRNILWEEKKKEEVMNAVNHQHQ